jgi:hypothetical protein
MTGIIIKALLGLFVWMVLPMLIYKKRTPQHFVNIACKIVGILMLGFAGVDLVKWLLNFK